MQVPCQLKYPCVDSRRGGMHIRIGKVHSPHVLTTAAERAGVTALLHLALRAASTAGRDACLDAVVESLLSHCVVKSLATRERVIEIHRAPMKNS